MNHFEKIAVQLESYGLDAILLTGEANRGTGTAQSAQSQINGLAIAHISIREGASSGNGQAIAAHNASNGRAAEFLGR